MDDETRQPRSEDDYMQMAMSAIGANTPHDLWQWVEDRKTVAVPLVFATKEGQVNYARGVKVGAWLAITQTINKMIEEATV